MGKEEGGSWNSDTCITRVEINTFVLAIPLKIKVFLRAVLWIRIHLIGIRI
jgi:hypothetical protein